MHYRYKRWFTLPGKFVCIEWNPLPGIFIGYLFNTLYIRQPNGIIVQLLFYTLLYFIVLLCILFREDELRQVILPFGRLGFGLSVIGGRGNGLFIRSERHTDRSLKTGDQIIEVKMNFIFLCCFVNLQLFYRSAYAITMCICVQWDIYERSFPITYLCWNNMLTIIIAYG